MSLSPITKSFHPGMSDHSSYKCLLETGFIPFFEERAGNLSEIEIAQYLWLNPNARLSEGMIKKVNEVAVYLKGQGFELRGAKADGNCFFHAFLENYKSSSIKIPLLDVQEEKISWLRESVATQYKNSPKAAEERGFERIEAIKEDKTWVTADEGGLLAKYLDIPIRVVTINEERGECGIDDMLISTNLDMKSWKDAIDESEKPKEYILIVDLGGHFIYARPLSYKPIESSLKITSKADKKKSSIYHKEVPDLTTRTISLSDEKGKSKCRHIKQSYNDSLDAITHHVASLTLEQQEMLPAYIVNMPIKVNSDDEGETSSDEEFDGTFPMYAFHRPHEYFRLLPENEGTGSKTKRGSIVNDLLLPDPDNLPPKDEKEGSKTKRESSDPDNLPQKKRNQTTRVLSLLEIEASHINGEEDINRLGISLGFNKMRSLSNRRNSTLKRHVNEKLETKIPNRKIGFFWDGIWQKNIQDSWLEIRYEEVRRFYRQLKRFNPFIAKQFREVAERRRAHMVPYREIRDAIKNHENTKQLTQLFRQAQQNRDAYIVFLDDDIRSFHHRSGAPGAFSVFDANYLAIRFEICSPGYTIREPENRALEVGVLADMAVRQGTAQYIKRGVYYPEPCTAVKIPIGCDTVPENFSDHWDKHYESPKEMPRLIDAILKNRQLDAQQSMVFDARGAIVTACPMRMQRSFSCQPTQKNGIILWGIADFKTMRGINQSHYNARDWALNLLPALTIRSKLNIGNYELSDKKVINDVLTSLLSRLFNAFDPVELAQRVAAEKRQPFQVCLIDFLENDKTYEKSLTEAIPIAKSRRKIRAPRKNAKDREEALKKCNAVNTIWQIVDQLSTISGLLDMVSRMLEQDFSKELSAAANESGKNLIEVFSNNLCLNYRELMIEALTNLINQGRKPVGLIIISTLNLNDLDSETIEEEIPELFLDIIDGVLLAQPGSIRDMKSRLSELKPDDFYGISALHIAALAGNLPIIRWLMEEDSETFKTSITDHHQFIPLDYALAHCRDNGINLDLITALCDDDTVEDIQEIVSESLDSDFDKVLILDHLLREWGDAVIRKYEGNLFIEAIRNDYDELAQEMSGCDDYSDDICNVMLDLAPAVDERFLKWAEEEHIRWVRDQLCETDMIIFNLNLGFGEFDHSSEEEPGYFYESMEDDDFSNDMK